MMKTVVFDLDSTLADTRPRWHLLDEENREATDWVAYARACKDDIPMAGPVALTRLLGEVGVFVLILTGRDESSYSATVEWLWRNRVWFNSIIMRRSGDNRPNEVFKVERLNEWRRNCPWADVRFLVDDWPPVVEALDLPVLLVNPLYHEEPLDPAKAVLL